MPRYDAPRPAGSFRSSLRSDPRYDERGPLDDGDSDPGSDVTQSEWGIEARHLRATPDESAEAPRRRDAEERYDERPVTAKEQYDQRVSREVLPEEEELTGWALMKKCVPATCVERAAIRFSTPNGRSDGILKCDIRAHLRTRVATTRARSSRASEMRLQRHPLGEARVLAKRVAASRSPPVQPRRGAKHALTVSVETTRTRD